MIQIAEIGIKGIGPFTKGQRLPILKGVTYVYGLNKTTGEDNSNAAGKSLLAATIGEVMYEAPMVGIKQDKTKSGLRYVKFLSRGKQVTVTRTGRKLSVEVNGKQVAATKTKAADALAKLWPIGEDEYRTFGYLDSRVPHPLVMGTSLQRKAFFSEFFGLEQLAQEKKVVLQHLSRLKETRATFVEASANYANLSKDVLDQASLDELALNIRRLERKVDAVVKSATQATAIRRLVAIEETLGAKIKDLPLDADEDSVEIARRGLRQANAAAQAMDDYRVYRNELKRWRAATEDLPEYDLRDLEKRAALYDKARLVEAPEKPKRVVAPEDPGYDYSQLVEERGRLRHELNHLKEFKRGVCDKCGQPVKQKRTQEEVSKALQSVDRKLAALEDYKEAQEEYGEYKRRVVDWRERKAAYELAQVDITELGTAKRLYEKVRRLPAKPDVVEKPEVLDVAEAERQLEMAELAFRHRDVLKAIRKLTAEDRELANTDDTDTLVGLQDKLSTLRARLAAHARVHEEAKAQRRRLRELKAELQDEEVLRALLRGYDDKAVKRLVVEAISEHFMVALNAYSGLVFSGYKFQFEWTSTQVSLLVTRPGHAPTDVRSLSGAEAKLFTLISVMALLKFVPKRKRLSLLVLDEPTSSFGQQSTELFHKLLPHMTKLIPSIMVVTPRTDERYPGAHEFTVVRDHLGARVCKA